jgi:serine/threonine protein kinase
MARAITADKLRILVVDDEEIPRTLLSEFLELQDYTVTTATDGVAALAFLANHEVEVVITDMFMPRKNGLELLTDIQNSNPTLPVIIVTAGPGVEAAVECMRRGAFDYLSKPFDMPKLKERVSKAIEQRLELGRQRPSGHFINLNARRFFGHYRILQVLGEGSVGIVFLAQSTHPAGGSRCYALKVLKPALLAEPEGQSSLSKRFAAEAQAASSVRHPNIIEIIEFGTTAEEKIPYLVMEYFEGRSLKHYVTHFRELDYGQKTRILRQVADALAAIHARGITHRDIKPHNILINDQLVAKISDFGIARLPDSELTASGEILGSPAYLAPETFTSAAVDQRADIFSFGILAYELYLGQKPFQADNIPRFAWLIQNEPPVEPRKLDPNFPAALQAMMARMLKKNPAHRYPAAADIVADFDCYLAGKETGAQRDFTTTQPEPAWQ